MKRDWLTGFGAIGILAVGYLIATPTGRALRIAVRGVPVGTPHAEIEARVGECDDGVRTFYSGTINVHPRITPEESRRTMEDYRNQQEAFTKASNWYWGPLFVVELDFAGYETSRLVGARVVPQVRVMGALNALGVVLIGVGVGMLARLSRRAALTRQGSPLPAPLA